MEDQNTLDNFETARLSESDRLKLKEEMRLGRSILFMCAAIGVIAALIVGLLSKDIIVSAIVLCALVLIGLLVCWYLNKDYKYDLTNNEKRLYRRHIDEIEMNPVVGETISHSSGLLPVAFFKRSPHIHTGYMLRSGKMRYPITPELNEQLKNDEWCMVSYATKSFQLLGVSKIGE